MDLKKLLFSEGNGHQTEEAAHRMGKNIFSRYTSDKALITRIYCELKKLNSQRINDPMKKWANGLDRNFSKEEGPWSKNTQRSAQHAWS
jgi:hypothetical protein